MITHPIEISGLSGGRISLSPEALDRFGAAVQGPVVFPGDPRWNAATLIWNGMIKKRPALVFQPASARDVAAAVTFARENKLLLSVKGGGHNIAGTAIGDGGLMLDLSHMKDVSVDPDARLARVGGGCLLQDVDRATQEHGLATVLGFVSETGVGGLTLGGGLGYLTRRFGYAVDNLQEVEIVTADGTIRTASRKENDDLFWAIRGGGGNFGVVTRFTFRLHPVGPMVYGGLIVWPFEQADEILKAYRKITSEAPRELAIWMVLLRAPAAPFVPADWHGRRVCTMVVCYSGDLARTSAVLAPIRALPEPAMDLLREQPYSQLQSFLDQTEPKGHHYYWKTEYASVLSDEQFTLMRESFGECPIPEAQIGILHVGGALNDHEADDGAVGNRDVHYAVGVNGVWEPDEPHEAEFRRWIRDAWLRLRPYSLGRTYINFQTEDEDDERVRATYGANYDRLAAIKRKYDPDNLFRVNRNIRSA